MTDKPVALKFQVELEFRNVSFEEGGKTGAVPGEKTLGARIRTNNKLNPHKTPSPGIEPGPHWWEASALTTAPFLLPMGKKKNQWRNLTRQLKSYPTMV